MNEARQPFHEELLNAEKTTPALKEHYQKEIQAMFEKKLTGVRRWAWLGSAILGIGFIGVFGTCAVIAPAEFPWWGRVIFAVGALSGIGCLIQGLRIFWRGSLNLKSDTAFATFMVWGVLVIIMTLSLVYAPDNIHGLRMLLYSMAFLVMFIPFLVRHLIEKTELKTREKLLEIEYRLAELSESKLPKDANLRL